MFGPDKCGNHNKIHFIIQHLNPVSGLYEEKAFNTTIGIRNDKRTHLYTLFIKNNNDFEIYIDKKVAFKGNLFTHMDPPVIPLKNIDDVTDMKPEDWVMDVQMRDSSAVKPEEWDEEVSTIFRIYIYLRIVCSYFNYIYIHMYVCIYIYIYINVCIYIYLCIYICIYIYICVIDT
jgi:hypothetical protein